VVAASGAAQLLQVLGQIAAPGIAAHGLTIGKAHINPAQIGKERGQFRPRRRRKRAIALWPGIKAFAGHAIGKNNLMLLEQQVKIPHPPFALHHPRATPGQLRQMLGAVKGFAAPPRIVMQQDAVLR